MEENQEGQAPKEQQSHQSAPNPVRGVKRAQKAVKTARRAAKVIKAAKTAKTLVALATAETGVGLLILLVNKKNIKRLAFFIGGLLFLLFFYLLGGFNSNKPTGDVSVTLTKVAPSAVPNNTEIPYTLNVSYTGNPNQIVVTDHIPDNTDYVSSGGPGSPTYDAATRTVTWTIPVSSTGTTTGTTGGGSTTGLPDVNATTFDDLMQGQARNINVLGDENNFVETVFKNVNPARPVSNRATYEPLIRKLYEASVAKNINPLIPLAIWGVESTYAFTSTGSDFGCKPFGTSHDAQLSCSLDVFDKWVKVFDQKAQSGVPVHFTSADLGYTPAADCPFSDSVAFAYEAYSPVCTLADKNEEARTNFTILIKDFLQAGAQ